MISCPFSYHLSDVELQKLGEFSLTWSHTEHTIGNCLKAALKFTDEEATSLIFPLSLEARVRWLRVISERLNQSAADAVEEFSLMLPGLQALRNQGIHGVIIRDESEKTSFLLKSKDRSITKEDIFSCEEFTNYCARVAYCVRFALFPDAEGLLQALPERPDIPAALEQYIHIGKTKGQPPPSQPLSSPR